MPAVLPHEVLARVVAWHNRHPLALRIGPMGPVSALRETSSVFAALIGWLFLKETLTARRLGACIVIACGALFLGLGR